MKFAHTKLNRWWMLPVMIGLLVPLMLTAPTASADAHEFYLSVYHGINGRSLGLDKDLPVDIYVNTVPGEGDPVMQDFTFRTRIDGIKMEAGTYTFYVTLAGQTDPIMMFGPASIDGGADVSVHAKLSAGKTPALKVKVK